MKPILVKQSEDNLQKACVNYLKLQFPHVLFFHPANGGFRNKIEAAKLKAMGVKPGVSDLLILERNEKYAGLAIELKTGRNQPTELQKEFLYQLEKRNWLTAVIYSIEAFIELVNEYFKKQKYDTYKRN